MLHHQEIIPTSQFLQNIQLSLLFYDYHSSFISVVSQPETIPDIQKESGLGMVDYLAVTEAVATSSKAKTRKTTYNHWSNKDRFTIGKWTCSYCTKVFQ